MEKIFSSPCAAVAVRMANKVTSMPLKMMLLAISDNSNQDLSFDSGF